MRWFGRQPNKRVVTMHQGPLLQRIFHRFFPQKSLYKSPQMDDSWQKIEPEERRSLAIQFLEKGERCLRKNDLSALQLFEKASILDPSNPNIWYRQGLAFFEYGTHSGKEKALLLASKSFKIATNMNPTLFQAYLAWGNVLSYLGEVHNEHHYFLAAKSKYQKAISLSENQQKAVLAELYWDYAVVWAHISDNSGEAVDVRMAIEAFETSLKYQDLAPPEFWIDYGNAHIQMGILITDSRLYLQAIECFEKSLAQSPRYNEALNCLGHAYAQLYINTLDEQHFNKANENYKKACELNPQDAELHLDWAQLLGESGRLNKDIKKLRLSVEKCVRANHYSPKNFQILGQWVESLSLLGTYTNRLDLIIEAEEKIIKASDLYCDEPDIWHAYGICLSALGNYYEEAEFHELAIEKFQFGLSLDRTNAELWHSLAIAHSEVGKLCEDLDMLERGAKFFSKAMDLKPSTPSLIFDSATNLLKLAEISNDQKTLELALYQFETTIQNQKDVLLHHPEWLYQYACALDLLGDLSEEEAPYERAEEILLHVLLIDPDYPSIHYRLALCFFHHAEFTCDPELFKRSLSYFQLAIKQDTEDENIYLDWGLTLISYAHQTDVENVNDLYHEAEQKITRAGQQGNQQAYYHLACLYSLLGRYHEAMLLIEKAQKHDVLPPVEELLQDDWLDGLRSTEAFSLFLSKLESRHQREV